MRWAPGILLAGVAGVTACSKGGPCETAVPPPDTSASVEVDPSLACAIAVQKELAGGLTWTAKPGASSAPGSPTASPGVDGGSGPFAIAQNGFTASTDCTTACSFNYNECFLPDGYLEAYVGAESTAGGAGPAAQGHAIGTASDGGSACPDVTSVTVTCAYTSAGFCE